MSSLQKSRQFDLSFVAILVIDDNLHMRTIIKSILKSYGIRKIYDAAHAMAGLEVLQKHNVDLVIVDYQMDILNGVEFTQMLRCSMDSPDPFLPVIMLTAYTERTRVEKARDAGVTEFLSKPIRAKDLYIRILQSLEKPRQFIKSASYTGPDRRRSKQRYDGKERRNTTLEI